MHTTREHGTRHVLFCGPPSFALTHNKCSLSFAIFPRAKTENKTWCLYFQGSIPFFQDYVVKAVTDLELLPFIFDNADTGCGW